MKHTDLTYLKELSNGSNEFVKEMLSIFIKEMPEAISKIETHLQKKEWQLLRGVLHKIKPSITFVGLKEIEEVVKDAEEYAGSQTNLDKLPEMIMKIKTTCTEGIHELQEELK